jgi:hypothetical protein
MWSEIDNTACGMEFRMCNGPSWASTTRRLRRRAVERAMTDKLILLIGQSNIGIGGRAWHFPAQPTPFVRRE